MNMARHIKEAIPLSVVGAVQRLLERSAGLRIDSERDSRVERAIRTRREEVDAANYENYLSILTADPSGQELRSLFNLVTVNETYFFRTRRFFEVFDELVGALILRRPAQRSLAIWSAACSTGEEPYSIAIRCKERLEKLHGWHLDLLASDISSAALARAREGLYDAWSFRGIDSVDSALMEHFEQRGASYQIVSPLRAMVRFEYHNLNLGQAPEPSRQKQWDVIFLRNVLLYFSPTAVDAILQRISAVLADDGLLFVGECESLQAYHDRFVPVSHRGVFFYQKRLSPKQPMTLSNSGLYLTAQRTDDDWQPPPSRPKAPSATPRQPPSPPSASLESLLGAGDYLGAIALSGELLARDALHIDAHVALGIAHFNLGDYEACLASLRNALYLVPHLPVARFFVGRALQALGERRLANRAFDTALSEAVASTAEKLSLGFDRLELLRALKLAVDSIREDGDSR